MQTLSISDNSFLIIKMLNNRHFSFTYNNDKIKIDKKLFSKPK